MSHWVLWSAYYCLIDGCRTGSLGQIAVGGGKEQMLIDFWGLVSPKTQDHIWGRGEQMERLY